MEIMRKFLTRHAGKIYDVYCNIFNLENRYKNACLTKCTQATL